MLHTLSKNQRRLLMLLCEQNSFVQGLDIASKLGISDRTIRNDVAQLNKILTNYGARIEAIRGKGYRLCTSSISALHKLIYADESIGIQDDRVRYIILKLINADSPLQLGDLQDEIFVSHTTLDNDIRTIKSRLSEDVPYLHLVRNENSITFENNEKKKRIVLITMFADDWDYNSEEGLRKRNTYLDPHIFDVISAAVKDSLYANKIRLDDFGLVSFVFTAAITHYRILQNHILVEPANCTADEKITICISQLCSRLEVELGIAIPLAERLWLEEQLLNRILYGRSLKPGREVISKMDPRIGQVARAGLSLIAEVFGINLDEDAILLEQLTMLIFSFHERPSYLKPPKSQIGEILKNEYPFTYELTFLFYNLYFQTFGRPFCGSELSEIGGLLAAAIARITDAKVSNGIPVALATDLSYSSAKFLMTRLQSVFPGEINLSGPFAIYEKQYIRDSGASLILSTTSPHLLQDESNTILPISLQMRQNELMQIWSYLQEYRKSKLYPPLGKGFCQLFHEAFFIYGAECETWEEAVAILADRLQEQGVVAEKFKDAVIHREKIISNAFEKGFAIPRAILESGSQTLCAVAVLKNPILWGKWKVSLVFLPVAKKGEEIQVARIVSKVMAFMQKKESTKRLAMTADFQEFMSLLYSEA